MYFFSLPGDIYTSRSESARYYGIIVTSVGECLENVLMSLAPGARACYVRMNATGEGEGGE